jgi:hypothetical protein
VILVDCVRRFRFLDHGLPWFSLGDGWMDGQIELHVSVEVGVEGDSAFGVSKGCQLTT